MVFCFILSDTAFVCLCAGLTCGMYCVTFAALRGLLLSHYGMKPLWCWPAVCSRGGPLKRATCPVPRHCQTTIATLSPGDVAPLPLGRLRVTHSH